MKTLSVLLLCGILHLLVVIDRASSERLITIHEVYGTYPSELTTRVGASKLVVVGTVKAKRFVWDAFEREPATEITVVVDEIIKGTPNAGEDAVKFTVSGGEAANPWTSELIKKAVRHSNTLQIGERTLFFFDQMYKSTARYKAHPYDGIYLDSHHAVSIENGTVTIGLLGEQHPNVMLPVDLVVLLGKATIVDRETAMMIEAAIHKVMLEPNLDPGPVDFAKKFIKRLIHTCENLLQGYEAGVNMAMKEVQRGEHDSVVIVSSQTFAEEKGYCRGFVDTIRHYFDVDYYCICNRHWSYQIARPERR